MVTATVVHLIGQLGRGGSERQLFYLTRALHKRGWRQSVVSFNPGGALEDCIQASGIRIFGIPRHPFKPWRLWRLMRVIQKEQPHILLCWSSQMAVYAHWLPGVRKLRRIFAIRGNLLLDRRMDKRQRWLFLFRRALETADCVVSNSHQNLHLLSQCGMKLPENEVIGNIVFAHGRAHPATPVSTPRIVAAGSLRPVKAHDLLLEALSRVAAGGLAFELLVAGNGPERSRLEQLTTQLGIHDRVRFLGEVENVPELLATADLLVHPSISEGLSNSVLEGMAEGVPVVATRVGGIPEAIRDGITGLLVAPGDTEALTHAIRKLLVNPVLRGRLGKAGLQYVRQHCDESRIVSQYEQVFHHLLQT